MTQPITAKSKRLLKKSAPNLYALLQKWHSALRYERVKRRALSVIARIVSRHGLKVLRGPFAGMACIPDALTMDRAPMLLGCYESELHEPLAMLSTRAYSTIVDIGCAEGYYAVGLCRLFPGARVHAFDIDPHAQQLCKQMAQANGVRDRVNIHGLCDVSWLGSLPAKPTLIFCDCEGCELEILQPNLIADIRCFDLVVELHDHLKPGIRDAITGRFSPTHQITLISATQRDSEAYSEISFLAPDDRKLAVTEFRPGTMQWAVMVPKARA